MITIISLLFFFFLLLLLLFPVSFEDHQEIVLKFSAVQKQLSDSAHVSTTLNATGLNVLILM